MIAITFALSAESSDLTSLLEKPALHSREGVESIRGRLHGKSVAVIHTGVGRKICCERMEVLLRRERFEYLISAGFAGALEKDLRVGDLLIAENFSSPVLLRSPHLDLADDGLFLGKLLTASGVITSSAEREQLAKETGAAAVDMETEFIADACAEIDLPFLSLRAISDTAAEPFPAPPHVLFDLDKQKTDFARLALYLATHPGAISRLNSFRERVAGARKNLTATLEKILRADLL
ncbi:MAG: adenosylhomocysteine nucleosidase [Verrucomicrobiota bacterium]